MTPARWGWVVAGLDTVTWALSRVRGGWGDDVPDEIRAAAAEAADRLETIGRYARKRMNETPANDTPPANDTLPIDNRCPRRRCRGDMEGGEFHDGSENRCTKCGRRAVLVEYPHKFVWMVPL